MQAMQAQIATINHQAVNIESTSSVDEDYS